MIAKKLGQLLVELEVVKQSHLDAALRHQQTYGGRLGDVLIRMNLLDEERLCEVLAQQRAVPFVDVEGYPIDVELVKQVGLAKMKRFHFIPLYSEMVGKARRIIIATAHATDLRALDEISFVIGKPVRGVMASLPSLGRTIARIERDYADKLAVSHDEPADDTIRLLRPHISDSSDTHFSAPRARLYFASIARRAR